MKRVLGCLFAIFISMTLISCSNGNENSNSNIDNNIADESYVEYEIPEVFVIRCYFYDYDDCSNYKECAYLLYDQNGNVFRYDRPEDKIIELEDLFSYYMDGLIEDKLRLIKTFSDKEGVQNCVSNLQELIHNEDFVIDSDSNITVGTVSVYHEEWYGLYYDENQELKKVCLYIDEEYSRKVPNDKRAGSIVTWLEYTED